MPATVSQVRRSAKRLLRWCLVDDRVEESRARAVVQQVLKSKRRGYVAVLTEFKRLLAMDSARHTAKIDSAVPLQIDLRTRISDGLERTYGGGIQAQFVQNPDLIGGIRIRISSDVYDGTVRSRLAALAASFGIRSR
jgi:F-type H+-transporting ATPase subunit delta